MHPHTTAPPAASIRAIPSGAIVALVVGSVWRWGVLIVDKWNQPLLLNDSFYYSAQARQLADGTFFREIFVDQPGAEHGPLTSVLMAPVSWISDPVPWQRMVTIVCGMATIVLIAALAGRLAGQRAAVWGAWIAALYPNLWMNDGLVMSESVSVLLVTSVLLAVHRRLHSASTFSSVMIGVLAGLATLARSELVLLAAGVVAVVAIVDRRHDPSWRTWILRPALVAGAALLTVAPWVAFNLVRFERPVTLTTNDGTTLLGSYCDRTFSGPERGGWSVFCVTDDDPAYSMDEEPSVRSARQRSMAFTYARHHARDVPAVVAARLGRTLDVYGLGSLVAQDVGEERYRWASRAGIVSWWVLAGAALVGIRHVRRWERWVLALPVAAVLVTTVVFYGGHRIRSSMEPTVVVLAAVAAVTTLDRWRMRERI